MDSLKKNSLDGPDTGPSQEPLCLRLLDGPLAGSRWSLGRSPILIGRGMGCQIRLDDPSVSRQHCEVLSTESEGFVLRHLGQRTETLVNGDAVTHSILRLGDELRIGDYHVLVDQLAPSEVEISGDETPGQRTRTPSAGLRRLAARTNEMDPSIGDWLIELLASLSQAENLDQVATAAQATLSRCFAAERVWIARYLGRGDQVVLHPPPMRDHTQAIPMRLLGEVCRTREPLAMNELDDSGWSVLIAPLIIDGQTFGALGIRVPESQQLERLKERLLYAANALAPILRTIERIERLASSISSDRHERQGDASTFLGSSAIACEVRERARRIAQARASVLILGETGSGKEVIARIIHALSPRAEGPFVAVNCAAIPDELFESEVFGHERGSFTGATARRAGLLAQAHGGTLFLDEVGELSLANQARILRAIDTGCFRPVGASKEIQVDTRIISATNRILPDPEHAYFRLDLYHRLATMTLHVPPLREHADDIPTLAQHFLDGIRIECPSGPRAFSGDAMELLCTHNWPGNVRELRNVVERAFYESQGTLISEKDLGLLPVVDRKPTAQIMKPLEELEREHLLATLNNLEWKIAKVASALGVSRGTVYYKMARLGIVKSK